MLRQLHSAVRRFLLAAAAISLSLTAAASAGDVVINEIHYDPADKTVPEEFIELYNRSGSEIDLSGWFFSGGVRYAFPPGAAIAAGGYLVVAEDPATVEALYGSTGVLGPYEGRLENEGELVILRDAEGTIVDQVEYDTSFPWPIDATGEGSSMELIDPALDNGLGSSWRASGWFQAPDAERVHLIPPEAHEWLYRPATSEPSDPPEAWREVDFEEDGSWRTGQAGFGYGDDDDNTLIEDMQGNYTGIYMRKRFEMSAGEIEALPRFLVLGIFVDDGAIFWLNGLELTRYKVAEGPQPFDSLASGSGEARWTNIEIPRPAQFLRAGQNVLAVHAMNRTITSADFSADAALFLPGSEDYESSALARLPTPGSENTVFSRSAPPQILQVGHHPLQPSDDRQIIFTAEAADPDGVEAVSLGVQIVPPGGYVPAWLPLEPATLLSSPLTELAPNPAFEDPASWSSIPMTDDGQGADARAGDGIYTAVLSPQANRTLLRYRITAADTAGNEVTAPFPDDPSLNFACFVYNGVPEYVATRLSVHPEGAGHVWPAELMSSLPVYFMITRNQDLMHCIAYNSSWQIPKSNENARDKFNWECAFVYEGRVHDHVMYRLRQANDRYGGSGKRSMRFRFQKGNWLRARDEWGRLYPTRWRTLNTGKQFDNKRVGNFGLTETLNAILWNLVGAPAPHFHNYHMRVIDAPEEAPSDSYGQYRGDFWGMFSAIEDYDPRFLDAHGLADGNLYKLKDGIFNGNLLRRNQGRYAVTNDSDFQNIRANLRPTQTDAWLDAHVNYERWYPYHAVVEGIRHYDFVPADSHSKNRAWYFEPDYSGSEFGRLWTLPWDSDASWGPSWNSGIDYSKNAIFAAPGKPAYKQEYRNVIREFRDLIWTEEVIHQMIDDLAARVIEFSRADRDRWRSAPADAGTQDFGAIETKILDMKRFAFVGWSGSTGPTVGAGGRARYLESLANAEGDLSSIPQTPAVAAATSELYRLDELTFRASEFQDPQGSDTFAAMKWRAGEIHDPEAPGFDPAAPRNYEWPAVWESEELTAFRSEITIPPTALKIGHTYRVRVKMKDTTGRWSHWSEPVEFTTSPPATRFPQQDALRVTEIMYHPLGDDGFEFIEIQNIGPTSIDLGGVSIRDGIEFDFSRSAVKILPAGEYVVVAGSLPAFAARYDAGRLPLAGEYSGRLSNSGETISIYWGSDLRIQQFTYDDRWHPLTDGFGYSLVIADASGPAEDWNRADGWRPGSRVHGTPGEGESETPPPGLQIPGDITQDGRLNISDAVGILHHLFLGARNPLPCGDGNIDDEANILLLDVGGDGSVTISDSIQLLGYLFLAGPPPPAGVECRPIPGCPDACAR